MDMMELWTKTCYLLKTNMNEVSFNTWIKESLRPYRLDGNVLILTAMVVYMKATIISLYKNLIEKCLSEAAGTAMTVNIVTEAEAATLPENSYSAGDSEGHDSADGSLNPKYTFDRFVVGSANRFAHAAALAVAEQPGKAYNPLFIYGGVGLGKTHLMHAIGHHIRQQDPTKNVLFVTSENFTNDLIYAIQTNKTVEFRQRFRNIDVLMVDDIQFIGTRDRTQEEFFHTFNTLHGAGKQIIVTADKQPKDIIGLEERLISRFQWGMIADIQRPDIETRIAILRKKTAQEHYEVSDDVLEMIAARVDSNIRELEGSLIRLTAYARLVGRPVTMSLCEEALKEVFAQNEPKPITAEVVIRAVASFYNITPEDIISSSRRREVAAPRQIAMYLAREMAGLSQPQIGQAFGGRDHSTVLYSCNLIARGVKENKDMARTIDDLRRRIREGM